MSNRKKLLYVTAHLSTGGMPQYLLKQIEYFNNDYEIEVIEVHNHSDIFVVQKNKIRNLVPLHTLGEDKEKIIDVISEINPDIIHFTEIPEHYLKSSILDTLFNNEIRTYDIVVSTHGSLTNPDEIRYHPDRYVLVSEWSRRKFQHLGIDTHIWEYPIEDIRYNKDSAKEELGFEKDWKHILMVGLFTRGKNQAEIFRVARQLQKFKIKFHFVGNQAGNFKKYWSPLMENKPDNCIVWGERTDVDKFYKAADMFYFSSTMELNPLSIKEALSHKLLCIFRRLDTYLDTYDNNPFVTYIDNDISKTKKIILETLKPSLNTIPGEFGFSEIYDLMINSSPTKAKFVEVGSWLGKSTNYLISKILESKKEISLTAIDTFRGDNNSNKIVADSFGGDVYYEFMDNAILSNQLGFYDIIKDNSITAANNFNNNDVTFLMLNTDGDYDSSYEEIKKWFHKVKPGGVLAGNNFPNSDSITKASQDFFYNTMANKSGVYFKRKPRIEIKHLMTKPNHSRERISSFSLKQLEKYGIDYTPIVNKVYDKRPPSDFCRRPHHISDKPGDFGNGIGPITGPHYGCFMAHRGAIESMRPDYDYTLIFEADAYIYSSLEEFAEVIYRACFISERDDVYQISFANNYSDRKIKVDSLFSKTASNQNLAHCYLIPNRHKQWWVDRFKDSPWDGWDIWMNVIFGEHHKLRYTTNKLHCKQSEGFSLIDQTLKTWSV